MDGPINFGERDRWWGLVVKGTDLSPMYCMNFNPSYTHHRLSIEWARRRAEPGSARRRGGRPLPRRAPRRRTTPASSPWVCLHHFTLPALVRRRRRLPRRAPTAPAPGRATSSSSPRRSAISSAAGSRSTRRTTTPAPRTAAGDGRPGQTTGSRRRWPTKRSTWPPPRRPCGCARPASRSSSIFGLSPIVAQDDDPPRPRAASPTLLRRLLGARARAVPRRRAARARARAGRAARPRRRVRPDRLLVLRGDGRRRRPPRRSTRPTRRSRRSATGSGPTASGSSSTGCTTSCPARRCWSPSTASAPTTTTSAPRYLDARPRGRARRDRSRRRRARLLPLDRRRQLRVAPRLRRRLRHHRPRPQRDGRAPGSCSAKPGRDRRRDARLAAGSLHPTSRRHPPRPARAHVPLPGPAGAVRWAAKDVFNPGAVVRDGRVHLLIRGEDTVGRYAGTSRIGLAISDDGVDFTVEPEPVLFPDDDAWQAWEWPGGCEDPRCRRVPRRRLRLHLQRLRRPHPDAVRRHLRPTCATWVKHGPAFADTSYVRRSSKSGAIVTSVRTGGSWRPASTGATGCTGARAPASRPPPTTSSAGRRWSSTPPATGT